MYTKGAKKVILQTLLFYCFFPSGIFFLIWICICAHVCEGPDMYHASLLVCISACAYVWFSVCYADCRKLALAIWLLEEHLHLWRQSSTCCESQQYRRLSKSLERRGELSQTQTDSFWCLAMKPVGDSWPHPNMRLAKLEEQTFCFF